MRCNFVVRFVFFNRLPLLSGVTALASEGPGELGVVAEGVRVELGQPFVDVPIYRAGGSRGQVSVEWFTREDTAVENRDFRDCSGIAYFADGQTKSMARIDLLAHSSLGSDLERKFIVELGLTEGGCLLGCYETTVTIFKFQGTWRL